MYKYIGDGPKPAVSKHTRGAIAAARILMNGEELIMTAFGRKSAEGVADLIDIQTQASEMLELLRCVAETVPGWAMGRDARALIAKIDGEEAL